MTSHCSRSLCSVPFILLSPHKPSFHGWIHMSRLCAFNIRLVSDITEHCFRAPLRASCAHSIARSDPYVAAFTRWRLPLYQLSVWCLICLRQFSEAVRWVFYSPKHLIFQVTILCFDIQANAVYTIKVLWLALKWSLFWSGICHVGKGVHQRI